MLLSMMVSSSFFAKYSITAFYGAVAVSVAAILKPNLIWNWTRGYTYEMVSPDAFMKLF